MQTNVIDLPEVADEGENSRLTATFYDLSGDPLNGAAIVQLRLTLQNEQDGSIINNRQDQDILNSNGGSVDASGTLIMKFDPADNVIVIPRNGFDENHIATIEWEWVDNDGAAQIANQKYRFGVSPALETPPPTELPAGSPI